MRPIRKPAVAGKFYPSDPVELNAVISSYLGVAEPLHGVPKALIVPHAGYVYSGPVAGSAYARIAAARGRITRVVLVGPSHYVHFTGLATSGAGCFTTPLGMVMLDREAIERILQLPQVSELDEAHSSEHCLEVHLPFLQKVLGEFRLVPLVVGEASTHDVAEVLDVLWGGEETLIVVSSDLSHYQDYETARSMDFATSLAIEGLKPEAIHGNQACGSRPIQGLLEAARAHHVHAMTVDLRNSGDTAGPRDNVVGYGAFVFH